MLESIEDLIHARPHVHKTAHYTPQEYRAYQAGYYTGVVYALRVAVEAIERFKRAARERRKAAKQKASA